MRLSSSVLTLGVLALGCALAAPEASARNRAILVGVSDYGAGIKPLQGPKTDIVMLWKTLRARGFAAEDITVLADGLPEDLASEARVECRRTDGAWVGPSCPTYDRINATLRGLKPTRDDFVFIHFSGHGVLVPPKLDAAPEPDFTDEAFLPIDAGAWDEATFAVKNALVDNEIGEALEVIRVRAGFVWAVFDACNSGTMTRGAEQVVTARRVESRELRIPDSAFAAARARWQEKRPETEAADHRLDRPAPLEDLDKGQGSGIVAFYAAQSGQLALEMHLPDFESPAMGAFTHALIKAIEALPNGTYRQIAQLIVESYGTLGGGMPAPLFEGDLDKQVFGGTAGERSFDAKVNYSDIRIEGGNLANLTEESIVALYEFGRAREPAALKGYVRIVEAALAHSLGEPIAFRGLAAPDLSGLPGKMSAVLAQRSLLFNVRVTAPPEAEFADVPAELAQTARAAIARLKSSDDRSAQLEIDVIEAAPHGQMSAPADYHLHIDDGRIWFADPTGGWGTEGERPSPSVAIGNAEDTARRLRDNLWLAAKARNLTQIAVAFRAQAGGDTNPIGESLQIQAYLLPDRNAPQDASADTDRHRCGSVSTKSIPAEARVNAINLGETPQLKHCDLVYLEISNKGPKPVDVTVLYIDSRAGIESFRPDGAVRIEPREVRPRIVTIQILTRDPRSGTALPAGLEQLVVIAVEREASSAFPLSFAYLEQKRLEEARRNSTTRGETSPFANWLEEASLAKPRQRAGVTPEASELDSVAMQLFRWNVIAPPQKVR